MKKKWIMKVSVGETIIKVSSVIANMSWKKKQILKRAFPFALATTLISPLYFTKESKANTIEFYPVIIIEDSTSTATETTSSNDSTSTPHKQKKEFTPPGLPYCKIKYYDSNSVVIDFWQKDGKKRELHYLVTNITEGMYSATVEFKHSSNGKDYGAWELNGEERAYLTDVCLYRAAKKILKGEMLTYGNALNEDLLRIEKVSGDVRDTITYDLVESDY